MKDIKLICVILISTLSAYSQIDSAFAQRASSSTLKRMAKNALKQNDPSSAIVLYEAYLKKQANDAQAMNNLAEAYLQIRDYKHAQVMFLKAYNADKDAVPEALYYHAQMQKSNGLYDSAKINFLRFKKEYRGSEKVLKKQTAKEITFCDSLQSIIKKDNKIIVQHLDTTINKVNSEGAPVNADQNTIVFSSLRTDKQEYIGDDDSTKTRKKKLYKAVRKGEAWKFAGEYGNTLNDDYFNSTNACFSPDKKRIYFTRCNPNIKGKMICAIYVSEKNGDIWSYPEKLPSEINDSKYTTTMPAVTTEKQKGNELIYFVSDRPNGKGGLDIWYSIYDNKKKIYKEPKNAGNKINTSQDEITPFFDNDSRTLYFSSNGLGGLGGFDIYKAVGNGVKFTSVENLGPPFNSGADDVYFTISSFQPEEGFLVSNREGGNALKNSTCCDDIYYYKQTQYIRVKLKGNISNTDNPVTTIPDATIEVYIKDKVNKEKIWIKNITSDSLGNFETNLEAGREYVLTARKKGFLSNSGEVSTMDVTSSTNLNKNLSLNRKPKGAIFIPNIQYEFGKSDLLPESKTVIDTTVLKLMENNPELIIEISAHTDSKGSDKLNMELSQARAESVVGYLIGKGIDPMQLEAKGYGESKPIAPNQNADGSDNPEGRAKNRRTEFQIIGELDDVEIIKGGN